MKRKNRYFKGQSEHKRRFSQFFNFFYNSSFHLNIIFLIRNFNNKVKFKLTAN